MCKILLYEKNMELQARIVAELAKYEGQFSLLVVRSLRHAYELICQQLIALCVVRADLGNKADVAFLSKCSAQYPQVPFILLTEKLPGNQANGEEPLNILKVINQPFELNAVAAAILDGLDAIDEGLLWQRIGSYGADVMTVPSSSEEYDCF